MLHFKGNETNNYNDYYGYVYEIPDTAATKPDTTQNFIDMRVTLTETLATFDFNRNLDTGDVKDQKLECGKSYNLEWFGSAKQLEITTDQKKGYFELKLDKDCKPLITRLNGPSNKPLF